MDTPEVVSVHDWIDSSGKIVLNRVRPILGMHQNGVLRAGEWAQIDAALVGVVRTPLPGIQDLIDAGLTKPLGGLGVVLSGYERVSDITEANVSIEGTTDGEKDTVDHDTVFVPIPIIHKDFDISIRTLSASRLSGAPLDLTLVERATRVVREKTESILFSGNAKQIGGYYLYGYTNHPQRITGTAVGDFGTAGNGYKTMVKALGALAALGFNGPFNVYVAQVQYNELLNMISTSYPKSELQAIIEGLPQIKSIKPSYNLNAGELVFVQMDSGTVDLAVAEDLRAVQWETKGGMLINFRVMTALAPRIKADINSHAGVLHYTGC